jgi:hypothetical protein
MSVIKRSSVFAALFVGLFVSSARAEGILTVTVPFPFVVDHRELPAGQYEIRNVEDVGSVIGIVQMGNGAAALAFTIPMEGHDPEGNQPVLVFVRHENQYQLSQIWRSGTEGRGLQGVGAASQVGRAESQSGQSVIAYVLKADWK